MTLETQDLIAKVTDQIEVNSDDHYGILIPKSSVIRILS